MLTEKYEFDRQTALDSRKWKHLSKLCLLLYQLLVLFLAVCQTVKIFCITQRNIPSFDPWSKCCHINVVAAFCSIKGGREV